MLMTIYDLKQKLDELEVDPAFYSLEGKVLNDRMVLYQSPRGWSVFYCDEAGLIMNEKFFHTETDACRYMHNYFKIR